MLKQKTKHGNQGLFKKHIQNFQYDDSTIITQKTTKIKPLIRSLQQSPQAVIKKSSKACIYSSNKKQSLQILTTKVN